MKTQTRILFLCFFLLVTIISNLLLLLPFQQSRRGPIKESFSLLKQFKTFFGAYLWAKLGFYLQIADRAKIPYYENREIPYLLDLITLVNPHDTNAFGMGAFHLWKHLGKVQMAESLLKRGLEENPKSFRLYFDLGNIYFFEKKDNRAAFVDFARAFERAYYFKDKEVALDFMRQCLKNLGDPPAGLHHYEKELQEEKKDNQVPYLKERLSLQGTFHYQMTDQGRRIGEAEIQVRKASGPGSPAGTSSVEVHEKISILPSGTFFYFLELAQNGLPLHFNVLTDSNPYGAFLKRYSFPYFDALGGVWITGTSLEEKRFPFKSGAYFLTHPLDWVIIGNLLAQTRLKRITINVFNPSSLTARTLLCVRSGKFSWRTSDDGKLFLDSGGILQLFEDHGRKLLLTDKTR